MSPFPTAIKPNGINSEPIYPTIFARDRAAAFDRIVERFPNAVIFFVGKGSCAC